jgi:hypothetical protein
MKKPILLLTSFTFALALAGCGKDEASHAASVNKDGTCTGSYVDDFRELYHAFEASKRLTNGSSDESIVATLNSNDASCKKFLSRHGSAPACVLTVNGVRQETIPATVRQNCALVSEQVRKNQEILQKARTPSRPAEIPATKPQVPENPIPGVPGQIGDDLLLSAIDATKLRFRVIDESKVQKLIEAGGRAFLLKGQTLTAEEFQSRVEELRAGEAVCTVIAENTEALKNSTIHSLTVQSEITDSSQGHPSRQWTGAVNETTGFFCFNVLNRNFKLRDIRASFRGVLEITIEE